MGKRTFDKEELNMLVRVYNESQTSTIVSSEEKKIETKKPQNMDEMIVLYMEMKTSHIVMESRIEKIENILSNLLVEITKGKQ